mmetsp:Transcript_29549/g.73752  ORF Transcript_29549/g.73752 Transcript_29549/m.73752 type:complete len:243 (+) Transcript_29549:688-1416(+)
MFLQLVHGHFLSLWSGVDFGTRNSGGGEIGRRLSGGFSRQPLHPNDSLHWIDSLDDANGDIHLRRYRGADHPRLRERTAHAAVTTAQPGVDNGGCVIAAAAAAAVAAATCFGANRPKRILLYRLDDELLGPEVVLAKVGDRHQLTCMHPPRDPPVLPVDVDPRVRSDDNGGGTHGYRLEVCDTRCHRRWSVVTSPASVDASRHVSSEECSGASAHQTADAAAAAVCPFCLRECERGCRTRIY